ncbi:hypothetical protein [Micromonospora sp. NPDC005220]|uniref:hypothetical protein n=1 Tax=Micromonospora sp. NPDC005220 TaxID=3155589 RepID=UPI0033AC4B03
MGLWIGEDNAMATDSEYHISSHDWPAGSEANDLTFEQANQVFDLFDSYYPLAVQGLSSVTIPVPQETDD